MVLRKWVPLLARAAFATVALIMMAGIFRSFGKYLELATHFRVQYLLVAALSLPVLIYFRSWTWAALCGAYVIVNLALLIPFYVRPAPTARDGHTAPLKLLLFNVNFLNTRYEEVARFIEAENADVVVAQEVTAGWLAGLERVRATHPHAVAQPFDGDGSGIALFSRLPIIESKIVYVGSPDRPAIFARLNVGGAVVSLFTIHPRAPLRPGHFEARNEQLLASAAFVRALPEPKIFVGDLNTTPWSPYFRRMETEMGLTNARRGFGLLPTWPVGNRVSLLMLPIDHCFVSRDIQVTGVATGPACGSDHLPLIINLAVPIGDGN